MNGNGAIADDLGTVLGNSDPRIRPGTLRDNQNELPKVNEPRNGVGAAYVLYGSKNGFAPRLNVSDAGFKGVQIRGEKLDDHAGFALSGVGDVNGDSIDDIIMVAAGKLSGDFTNGFPIITSNNDKSLGGVTYVVFGKIGQAPGQIDLASLDGTNGFKISAGNTVNQAGDINGDGINDLIIGLPNGGQSSTIGTSAA